MSTWKYKSELSPHVKLDLHTHTLQIKGFLIIHLMPAVYALNSRIGLPRYVSIQLNYPRNRVTRRITNLSVRQCTYAYK